MSEIVLPDQIIERYKANLSVLNDRLNDFKDDPLEVPPDLLHPIYTNELIISNRRISLTPEEELMVLDKMEQWYVSHEGSFPKPEWLAIQRTKIQGEFTSK